MKDYGKKEGSCKGAKGNESAIDEGLRDKTAPHSVKGMYKPSDKAQRMPKGTDRA